MLQNSQSAEFSQRERPVLSPTEGAHVLHLWELNAEFRPDEIPNQLQRDAKKVASKQSSGDIRPKGVFCFM